ncbi:hypothetical protein H4R34_004470 [Dimargaris verticillata]|uniref:6-phosphogluconate dehydrogenase NADP-binding domain-containing protein n=1 Tax=Dimargaris verticillata TaxID=2761393 RepID=A0A9W8B2I6_9FUNG|nr:hypothetical protein H4R34_004470 [Dimargaris verticillata]
MAALRVGWIGLGNMGQPMALNLQSLLTRTHASADTAAALPFPVDPQLRVYNRTPSKAAAVEALGAHVCSTVQALAQDCDVIFTSLNNDQTVVAVYRDILAALRTRQVPDNLPQTPVYLVETSTISPELSRQLDQDVQLVAGAQPHDQSPIHFLRCPVFGPPVYAQTSSLIWVLSGPAQACADIRALVIPSLGRGVIEMGEDVAKGSRMKLVGNFFVASAIEAVAEGAALAEASGVSVSKMMEFIQWGYPQGSFLNYGKKTLRPEEIPAHASTVSSVPTMVPIAASDATISTAAMASARAEEPMTSDTNPLTVPTQFRATMAQTPVGTPLSEDSDGMADGQPSNQVVKDDFITDVGFNVDLCLKDTRLIRDMAQKSNCRLPVIEALETHLKAVQAKGLNEWDAITAVVATRWEAGLPGYYNDTTHPQRSPPE